jgi:hypothetical protein
VSYWEWGKLIGTAMLMALALDAIGLAVWWFFIK